LAGIKKYRKSMAKDNTGKSFMWSVKVPRHLNELLEKYIKKDSYQTKSEFVRTAVRDRLREELAKMEVEVSAIA